jgi:undecaprenyl diphosphate synthase
MIQKSEFFHPHSDHIVKHIGLIPDGGRRWADINDVSLEESYEVTRNKLADFLPRILDYGIAEISIYLSSKQNFRRKGHEIEAFTNQVLLSLPNEVLHLSSKFGLKVVVAGDLSNHPENFKQVVEKLLDKSSNEINGIINLCIAYDPFDEINYAMKTIQNGENIWSGLWVNTPLDLIIRSGDANLLSNFLPLQSGFARVYFTDKLFNDLTWEEVKGNIEHYRHLERKYGV